MYTYGVGKSRFTVVYMVLYIVNLLLPIPVYINVIAIDFLLFKLHFIDYAITLVLIFPLLHAPPSTPYSFRQSPHNCSCPWDKHISVLAVPFLYCTLHPHGYSVTTYLCFLIPSPLHPFPSFGPHYQDTESK